MQDQDVKRKVVVFCSDYILCLGLVRCLGEAGYRPECYCYGTSNYILKSKYVSKGILFNTKEECLSYLISDYPSLEVRPILITQPDPPAYLVDINKDILEKKFIVSSAGAQGKISYWMDKTIMCGLAEKHGFLIPWSRELKKNEPIPNDISYPVFTKSKKSAAGGKKEEKVCNTIDDLRDVLSIAESDSIIVMQYVRKTREINYIGLAVKGHIYLDYHDIRDRFPLGGYGNYNTFVRCKYDEFYYRIINLIKATNYEGLFDVEFLIDRDGNKYFMEINFRADGELYKLCEGVNLPAEWCRLCVVPEQDLPERLELKKNTFIGITETEDFKDSVLGKQVNLFKWLWDFFTADRRMLLNTKDPLPAIYRLLEIIKCRL